MQRPLLLLAVVALTLFAQWVPPDAEAQAAPTHRAGRPLAPTAGIWIEEAVTDPQTDWDQSGSITTSDEYVVLRNAGSAAVNLTGWTLTMHDSTPETTTLHGTLAAGARLLQPNPPGQMNNDVRLVLRDASGTERDNVTLAAGGITTGNADGPRDEAVHLAGPWAGLRAPATHGLGLGPVWLEPAAPEWLPAANATLHIPAHAAPGIALGTVQVRIGTTTAPVTTTSAPWTTAPFAPPANATTYRLEGNGWHVDKALGGAPLGVRVDTAPPRIGTADDVAVSHPDGTLRWLPAAHDDESGLRTVQRTAANATASWELTDCPPCNLTGTNLTITIRATDNAGQTTTRTFPAVTDSAAPPRATALRFETGDLPSLTWTYNGEPLLHLRIETAEDPDGVWPIANHTLAPETRRFTDTTWAPGSDRAYRIVTVDRAGWENTTAWTALPADAAPPVRITANTTALAATLARSGQAELTLAFDRPVTEPPLLHLHIQAAQHTANGTLAPHAKSASYLLAPADAPPESGTLHLETSGGTATDGTEPQPWNLTLTWDLKPPEVVVEGTNDTWIRAARHTVRIRATDDTDPAPTLHITTHPTHAHLAGNASSAAIALNRDGRHNITGNATDANGNVRPFALRIGMDTAPPDISEPAARPTRWTATDPLVVQITDATSGVNATSVRIWVRNATTAAQPQEMDWTGDLLHLIPGSAMDGPFELYVAAADNAGNSAEGLLGSRLVVAGMPAPAPASPTATEPRSAPAPDAAGPAWAPVGAPTAKKAQGQAAFDLDVLHEAAPKHKASKSAAPGLGFAAAGAGVAATLGTVVHRFGRRRRTDG